CDFGNLNAVGRLQPRFDNAHAALEGQSHRVRLQLKLLRKPGRIAFEDIRRSSIVEKERALPILDRPNELALLPIVAQQLRLLQRFIRKWKSGENVKAAASDNRVLLDGKIQLAKLLTVFVRNRVDPTIAHCQGEKISRHPHALSETRNRC